MSGSGGLGWGWGWSWGLIVSLLDGVRAGGGRVRLCGFCGVVVRFISRNVNWGCPAG